MKDRLFAKIKINRTDAFAGIVFCSILILLLSVVKYGSPLPDEFDYISGINRISSGDNYIIDEWNPAQFVTVFLMPLAKLYLSVVGSAEGIFLFFRTVYAVVQTAVGVLFYVYFRKYGIVSVLAAAVLILFPPVFMTSYNNLLVSFSLLLGILLFCANGTKKTTLFLIGTVFSCVVLCDPFIAVLFFLYSAAVLIYNLTAKHKGKNMSGKSSAEASLLSFAAWRGILYGVFAAAAVFLLFFFLTSDIKKLPQAIKLFLSYIGSRNLHNKTDNAIVFLKPYILCLFADFAVFIAAFAAYRKNRIRAAQLLFVCLLAISFVFTAVIMCREEEYSLFLCLPLALTGLFAYILTKNKNKRLFLCFWLPGFIFAAMRGMSSLISKYVFFALLLTPAIIGLFFIRELLIELFPERTGEQDKKTTARTRTVLILRNTLICITAVVQIFVQLTRFIPGTKPYGTYLATSSTAAAVDTEIKNGPLKGIVTTAKSASKYELVLNDLDRINRLFRGKNLLIAEYCSWGYLYADCSCAGMSVICTYSDLEYLLKYYELNPDKIPDCLYLMTMLDYFIDTPTSVYDKYAAVANLEKYFDFFEAHFTCNTVFKSDCGYIIELSDFHTD